MIKFFRNMRLRLLRENRFTRYLLYALGEIFLVVIGILIALQINNWNQERQELEMSRKYHERIIEDLEIYIHRIQFEKENSDEVLNAITETVAMLEKSFMPESKKEVFDNAMKRYYQYQFETPNMATIEEMQSNGKLDLIYNVELRKDLLKFENFNQSIDNIFQSIGNNILNQTNYIDEYVRIYVDNSDYTATFETDFDAMAADKKLINHFSRFADHWRISSLFKVRMLERANKLKTSFEDELSTFK